MKPDKRQQLLIVLTIAAIALLVGDRLIYTPLTHWWQSRGQEIHKLRMQVTEGQTLQKRDKIVRSQWDEMRTNTLPNNPSRAQEQVLKAFQDWAQESGVSINAITPQWKNDADEYKTLVCRVDAAGTLWNVSRFLYDIEKGPLGLKLESVDINSRDNTGKQLTLGLQVSGLILTSEGK
jgi:Tfp pilus assembly protein PilO